MITILDANDTLAEIINDSPLKDEISGGIYKFERPDNSTVEDIVIIPLTQIDEVYSEGVINVNIHVPNIQISVTDKATGKVYPQMKPNTKRLKELLELAKVHFENLWGDGYINPYQMYLSSQNIISNGSAKDYFLNLRISYQNYK